MKRRDFINNYWQSYPAMPATAEVAGRILSLSENSITIEIGEKGESFQYDYDVVILPQRSSPKKFKLEDVLRIKDIIGLELSAEKIKNVWLLAPHLTEIDPSVHKPSRQRLEAWSTFLLQIRLFFIERGFLEASTPSLVTCPGTEPFLDVFSTKFNFGSTSKKFYLPTSPELHLKQMLAMDYGPLFEIKNCFRNGEISAHHQPEFSMLEWYRPYANLKDILLDLEDLLTELLPEEDISIRQISMQEIFQEFLNFDLRPDTTREQLYNLAMQNQLNVRETDSIDDLFGLIFVDQIEAKLVTGAPLIITNYPPFQAAYARINEAGWADRFELYWRGLEIANAFHEVNDPILQLERMKADLEKKTKIHKETFDIDQNFIQALQMAMPPSGGIALGLERLFMALNGIKNIQDLKPFIFHP